MIVSNSDYLRLLLASPDPVLIVADDDEERIVGCNPAAARLFGGSERDLLLQPLGTLIVNFVARAVAIDVDAYLESRDFVRAWAHVGGGLEPVSVGAVRGQADSKSRTAVFIRTDSSRLREPSEAEVSEARLQFALDSAGIGDWDMDLRTNTAFRSRIHDRCFGYDEPPEQWGYETFLAHVHPGDRERVDAAYRAAGAGAGDYDVEFRAVWPDGTVRWLWSKGRFYYDAAGTPIRVAGIQVDIDARKRIENRARIGALAMDATTDAIIITDARAPDGPVVYANAAFERMTGYPLHDVIGTNCRFLQGDDRDQPEIAEIRSAIEEGRATRVTLRNYRKDGTLFWNALAISPVRDGAGVVTHYVGIQTDVTQQRAMADELVQLANHDALTELPNRRLMEKRLDAALREANASGSLVGVAFLDLDRLKRINDSIGHGGGDDVLRVVASRLRATIAPRDVAARFGGDEFVVVMSDLADLGDAERRARRLQDALLPPETIDGLEISPTASMGIAIYPTHGSTGLEIIRAADTAMYAAKRTGRGTFRFFDPASMRPATDRIFAENALERALACGELALEYQPIYDARSGRIVSLEALLRWRHPERGTIPPGDFIPLAEESGLIVPIGEWVLGEICRQTRAWEARGVPLVPVAMNVSIAQLRRTDFLSRFAAIVADAGLDPQWLVLELTESIVMDNAEKFLDMLASLRAAGFRISIDDFGTGFSSLSYLKRISLDTLKIDKSFLDDVAHNRSAAAICQAVVTLAKSVGLTTIAEGVETVEQATFLREIGCDELQGYFFSRPVTPDVARQFLVTQGRPTA